MRFRMALVLSFIGITSVPLYLSGREPKTAADDPSISQLVAQLGSSMFAAREEASRRLDELGPKALEVLHLATKGQDPETRRRAADLVQRIERRVETEKLLTPRRIRLVYRDTPLPEAVQDIARKTGFTIELEGDRTKLAARRITLDTGEVPFWDALGRFCEQTGLTERRHDPVAGLEERLKGMTAQTARTKVIDLRNTSFETQDNRLVLVEGQAAPLPAFSYGALRIRALPPNTPLPASVRASAPIVVPLEIVPEPGIDWKRVLGVRIDKALDDRGRLLSVAPVFVGTGAEELAGSEEVLFISDADGALPFRVPRVFPILLGEGEEPSRQLKELRGTLTAWVQSQPEALFTVDQIMNASGKTLRASDGTTLRVLSANRTGEQINLRVSVTTEPQDASMRAMTGRVVRVNRRLRTWPTQLPTEGGKPVMVLTDSKGKDIELMTCALETFTITGRTTREFQLTYRGQEEPARLTFTGRRIGTVEVPFVLKDVPLK